ncbi:MAG: PP0621 family protein [Moraxellaceae bacterium]|nr:PP0621 family protein [Moraxellaceae bacterium]
MQKLLLFILLLVGIYFLRRALGAKKPGGASGSESGAQSTPALDGEAILACSRCGVLVPRSEGVSEHEHFYCSADHARLGPPNP